MYPSSDLNEQPLPKKSIDMSLHLQHLRQMGNIARKRCDSVALAVNKMDFP